MARHKKKRHTHKQHTNRFTKHNTKHNRKVWHTRDTKDPRTIYIYFVHVPKTAGSAIKQTLARNDTGDKSIKSEGWTLYTKSGIKVRIIANGHSASSSFTHSGPNVFKLAIIREPVQRFISAYNFVREGGKNHPNQDAVQQARKWAPYLQKYKTIDAFLTDESAVKYIMNPRTGHTHFEHLAKWINGRGGTPDIDLYLRQTHVNEDFQTFCDTFDLDLNATSAVEPFNVTLGKSKLTSQTNARIAKLLTEDSVLYATCVRDLPSLVQNTRDRFNTFVEQQRLVRTRRGSRRRSTVSRTIRPASAKANANANAKQARRSDADAKVLHIRPPSGVSNHFWHFMMGEFLPIMYVILKHRYKVVYVHKPTGDLGFPLHAFYHEVCNDANVELHITDASHPPATQYVTPLNWDWANQHEESKLLWVSQYLKRWASPHTTTTTCADEPPERTTWVVQDRSNAQPLDDFYKQYKMASKLVKRKVYGATRRQITNLKAVANRIRRTTTNGTLPVSVHYYDTDAHTLKEQIQQYSCANRLILGHGAGMVHMLWMQPDSKVIEIVPRHKFEQKNGAVQGATRLCKILKFDLKQIVVDTNHCSVDIPQILDAIS